MNLHIKTKVLPGHKIEVAMPELPIGDNFTWDDLI
jgi:hypothetical protein